MGNYTEGKPRDELEKVAEFPAVWGVEVRGGVVKGFVFSKIPLQFCRVWELMRADELERRMVTVDLLVKTSGKFSV